jgi:hypothetical protein
MTRSCHLSRDAPGGRWVTILILGIVLFAGCGGREEAGSPQSSTPSAIETSATTAPATTGELPEPAADTRSAILAAAAARDYDMLAPLLEPRLFLSDFGYGVDPVAQWRDQGTEPLEAIETLLNMRPAAARETNEGRLYQWPRFTADSDPGDMSPAEREALLSILGERELATAFLPETGYTGPRIGILADGSWWFFLQESGP